LTDSAQGASGDCGCCGSMRVAFSRMAALPWLGKLAGFVGGAFLAVLPYHCRGKTHIAARLNSTP